MGGSILIAKDNGVALNSLTFDYIIEKIRPYFRDTEHQCRNEIYEPVDEGGMSFLSLWEQNEKGVEAFFYAVSTAFEQEIKEGDLSLEAVWNEILDAIKLDSRLGSGSVT